MRKIRNVVRAALVGLGILALSTTSAGAHTTNPYSGWYVWQNTRTVYTYTGGSAQGVAWAQTTIKPSGNPDYPFYGFNVGGVGDYSNNGWNDCIEAWMDFKRINGAGTHRNPTVIRHCNTSGNVYGYHSGAITDYLQHYLLAGWDFNVCRAIRTSDGKWHRSECTNDQGHKPQAFPEFSGSMNHVTDHELSQWWCEGTPWDTRWEYGCRAYLHWV